jgi:hypothetical protein
LTDFVNSSGHLPIRTKTTTDGRLTPLSAQGIASSSSTSASAAGTLTGSTGAFTPPGSPLDFALMLRIKRAYRLAMQESRGPGESMWAEITRRNASVHDALLADDDRLQEILRDPGRSDLFYGFHSLFASRTELLRSSGAEQRQATSDALFQEILRLCQALGARRLHNPEAVQDHRSYGEADEQLGTALAALDSSFGTKVTFPNPYPDEFGILTSRGVASYRAIHAIYQAHRLRQLADVHGGRILEIGAGLGRTVGYGRNLGLRQCTIIDLPLANVAQASFLGAILGPESVSLLGEEPKSDSIRIATPEWLSKCGEDFDIVLNVDSMTEMDRKFADEYAVLNARG